MVEQACRESLALCFLFGAVLSFILDSVLGVDSA
jgi:hypothetical protein